MQAIPRRPWQRRRQSPTVRARCAAHLAFRLRFPSRLAPLDTTLTQLWLAVSLSRSPYCLFCCAVLVLLARSASSSLRVLGCYSAFPVELERITCFHSHLLTRSQLYQPPGQIGDVGTFFFLVPVLDSITQNDAGSCQHRAACSPPIRGFDPATRAFTHALAVALSYVPCFRKRYSLIPHPVPTQRQAHEMRSFLYSGSCASTTACPSAIALAIAGGPFGRRTRYSMCVQCV
ncbi:hypothetical protein EXIGLDRAFT_52049 [Exidia glandulosa HHB12029]|uniref:Uncharacterized protein n=1 Tax=Exidia glandulosa HHB12029 TaxID=1314781 RepID=A0A166MPY1_EXIGL|nr:hypothetical protein EXIGLDRAFT_52049 [Exidia glandulosa HHB12029]